MDLFFSRYVPLPLSGPGSYAFKPPTIVTAVDVENWWVVAGKTCMAAYQFKGAASYAAAKVNLANPGTYDCVDGAAYPTWATETGCTFNGSTQYLITGVAPDYNGGRYNRTIIGRFASASWPETNHFAWGCSYSAEYSLGYGKYYGATYYQGGFSQPGGAPPPEAVIGINLNGDCYLNGVRVGTTTTGGQFDYTSATIAIGAAHIDQSYGYFFNGQIVALAIYSDELLKSEMATKCRSLAAL
jgi:hypothetical protein